MLLIFDLDGTLIDPRDDIAASINHALVQVGADAQAATLIHRQIGRPLDDIFLDLIGDGDRERALSASAKYREHFYNHCADASQLYDGVADTLATLSRDHDLAVATTKQSFMAERVIDLFGLTPYFKKVQGTDGFPAKPAPDIILRLLTELDACATETWMVGDRTSDIEAAQNAGVRAVGVTYGIGTRTELVSAKPQALIDRFAELPAAINGSNP